VIGFVASKPQGDRNEELVLIGQNVVEVEFIAGQILKGSA
jgi:hypothetical protein